MSGSKTLPPDLGGGTPWIVIQQAPSYSLWKRVVIGLLVVGLIVSVLLNIGMYSAWGEYYRNTNPPTEKYHAGERTASAKIAVIKIHGTIMPPFTERWIKQIERTGKDDAVKGVLLDIDSPGGLVADSHQIYHKLRELNAKKPIAVQMKRMAASGGYYVAMGAGLEGKIFAEETTWTGSIGVIIPRYNAEELAKKVGVVSDPLKTGPLKDALSPFRELSPEERAVWDAILDDAYQRFLRVIAESRKNLNHEQIKALATGQIYTAEQAKSKGLVDELGYEEDAIKWLKEKCSLTEARVVTYENPRGLIDIVLGANSPPRTEVEALLEASVPRAMYYCSWGLATPPVRE